MSSWAKYKVVVLLLTYISHRGPVLLIIPESPPQKLFTSVPKLNRQEYHMGNLLKQVAGPSHIALIQQDWVGARESAFLPVSLLPSAGANDPGTSLRTTALGIRKTMPSGALREIAKSSLTWQLRPIFFHVVLTDILDEVVLDNSKGRV